MQPPTHLSLVLLALALLCVLACAQQQIILLNDNDDANSQVAIHSGSRKLLTLSHDEEEISSAFIVSTLDGNLHGIDINSAEILWTLKTPPGGPLISSSTSTMSEFIYSDDASAHKQVQVIPSVNGNIYLHVPGEAGVQKLPLNAKELVDMSPFTALDGTMYMSSKQTTGFLVNVRTGQLRCILRDKHQPYYASEYNSCTSLPSPEDEDDLIFMVRVDYAINAIDSTSGKLKWNITFSDCHPSNQDADIPTTSMAFSTNDGALYYLNHTGSSQTTTFQFNSQAISLFKQTADYKFQRINTLHITIAGSQGYNPILGDDEPSVFVSTDKDGALYAFEVNPLLLLKSKQERLSLPAATTNSSPSSNFTPHEQASPIPIKKPPISQHNPGKHNMWSSRKHLLTGYQVLRPFTYKQCLNPHVLKATKKNTTPWRAQLQGTDAFCKEYDALGNCILSSGHNGAPHNTSHQHDAERSFISSSGLAVIVVVLLLAAVLYFNILSFRQKKVEQKVEELLTENAKLKAREEQEQLQKAIDAERKRLEEKKAKEMAEEEEIQRKKQTKEKDALPTTKVGKIQLHKKKLLGHGSNGTVVFEGELMDHFNRKVAVKRMLREFYDAANHEVSLLIESDEHPNVVRYFAREDDDQFIYLALELCDTSLEKLVSEKKGKLKLEQKIQLLIQLCKAIEHIHNVCHLII